MGCWICGADKAETREHKIKRSDLKSQYTPTQEQPMYLYGEELKPRQLYGLNSKHLKFTNFICANCNNSRTQPHDNAWKIYSKSLLEISHAIKAPKNLRFNRIIPYNTKKHMRNVHLYFVKLFGCHIVDSDIPIEISSFSKSIMNETIHPYLHLSFGEFNENDSKIIGYTSQIECLEKSNIVAFATWFYQVGHLAVNVIYAITGEERLGLKNSWNPSRNSYKKFRYKLF